MRWRARIEAALRSPLGRVAVAILGVAVVGALLAHAGPARVGAAVVRVAPVLPLVFLLEGLYQLVELAALRRLYAEDRARLTWLEVVRVGLVAFAIGGVMPMGRPIVETVRGVALARFASAERATAAGTALQYLLLLSQAALSAVCALAALALDAPAILVGGLVANGAITLAMGLGLERAARGGLIAAGLSRLFRRTAAFAEGLGPKLREPIPASAVGLVLSGRVVQVVQYTVLAGALLGRLDGLRGLGIVGVQMIGASLGDLVPTHVGGTEALAPLGAQILACPLSDALAIPLVIHAQQAAWIALGFAAHALFPPRPVAEDAAPR